MNSETSLVANRVEPQAGHGVRPDRELASVPARFRSESGTPNNPQSLSSNASFAERQALTRGYTFSPELGGRVQLINPRGVPCGNFPDRETAARSAAFVQ